MVITSTTQEVHTMPSSPQEALEKLSALDAPIQSLRQQVASAISNDGHTLDFQARSSRQRLLNALLLEQLDLQAGLLGA